MTLRSVCTALAFALAATSTSAQDEGSGTDSADISGHWSFSTGPFHEIVCTMTGEVVLEPTGDPDVFEGELVARAACADGRRFEARQSAVAVRDCRALSITSTLVSVEPSSDRYLPDDFELRIVNGALMVGELRFGHVVAKAQFRRNGIIS